MIQEDKDLLLKDLCGRLPYLENCVQYDGKDYVVTGYGHGRVSLLSSMFSSAVGPCPQVEEVKLYLRPMTSMTEEEREELCELCEFFEPYNDRDDFSHYGIEIIEEFCVNDEKIPLREINYKVIDWLNTHHFDYRGLIERGLALEVPEDMYKNE